MEILSLINAREVILTSKKGAILLVTRKKVSLGKGTSFQPDLKRSHSRRPKREATHKREATQKSEATRKRIQFLGEPILA